MNAIHLKLMVNGDEKSYLLIVDFNGDRNEVFGLLANAGKPFLPEGMYLDIVPISDNSWKKVADNKPFYRKSCSVNRKFVHRFVNCFWYYWLDKFKFIEKSR